MQSVGYFPKEDEAALEEILTRCMHWATSGNEQLFKGSQASEK